MPPNEVSTTRSTPSSLTTTTTKVEVSYKKKKKDGQRELSEIKKTCAAHETLCRQFADCSLQLRENNAQLEILNETASFLKDRHSALRRQIAAQPTNVDEIKKLEKELATVNQQVQMWMRELEEVSDARTDLEIRFVRLRAALQKSVTSVQLASIDLDLLQNRHADRWKRFLADVQAEEAALAAAAEAAAEDSKNSAAES